MPGRAFSHAGSTPLAIMSDSFWLSGFSLEKMLSMMAKSNTPSAGSNVAHSVRST
ncbi:MAG: hypothetical protein PHC88_05870 [Terrimicrobiaceae bacterium]|nr:hypothetical protein [Terrimicrobiaceae bacterium]